jgi:hypothetical protein
VDGQLAGMAAIVDTIKDTSTKLLPVRLGWNPFWPKCCLKKKRVKFRSLRIREKELENKITVDEMKAAIEEQGCDLD